MNHEPQGPWLTLLLRHLPPDAGLGWDDLLVGHDFGFLAPAYTHEIGMGAQGLGNARSEAIRLGHGSY